MKIGGQNKIDDKLYKEVETIASAEYEKYEEWPSYVVDFLEKHPETITELCIQVAEKNKNASSEMVAMKIAMFLEESIKRNNQEKK